MHEAGGEEMRECFISQTPRGDYTSLSGETGNLAAEQLKDVFSRKRLQVIYIV